MARVKLLQIAKGLSFPLNAATQKFGWIGTSGGGKTYGAMRLAESFWDDKVQFVAIDPVGVWYGLRLDKGGKKPSNINIPIFGGLHGDIPLEPTSGPLIADLIVDKGICAIIDVSQFESDAEKARFAGAFADRLFFRKKARPSAMHLFIEECQEFVPQNPQRGEERMVHAFTRMQKIGRNFGIGTSLITQRPQEVSKRALNLAGTLLVFRTTGSHERKAIEVWMQDKSIKEQDLIGELPKLETGAPHLWSPEWLKESKVVNILEKRTFDASATPEVGRKAVARQLAPVDLERVKADMAATIEKAKAEDPKELKKEIGILKGKIVNLEKKKDTNSAPDKATITAAVGTAVAQREHELLVAFDKERQVYVDRLKKAGEYFRAIEELMKLPPGTKISPFKKMVSVPARPKIAKSEPIVPQVSTDGQVVDNTKMQKGELEILKALASIENGATREHITVLTGYKKSTRNRYIQFLQGKDLVAAEGDRIVATPAGIEALGSDYEPLPTGAALREHLLRTLPKGEADILKVLTDNHPSPVERETITEATGYQKSTRNRYIQYLKARELVEYSGTAVVASDNLF